MLYAQVYYFHSFTEHFFNTLNSSLTLLSSSILLLTTFLMHIISLASNYLLSMITIHYIFMCSIIFICYLIPAVFATKVITYATYYVLLPMFSILFTYYYYLLTTSQSKKKCRVGVSYPNSIFNT